MKYDKFLKGDFKLDKEQVTGVDYLVVHQWVMLCDDMGVGKTIQSLVPTFIDRFTTLIVCPSGLKINWKREILKFCPYDPVIHIASTQADLDSIDVGNTDYIIVSYELSQVVGFIYELCQCWIFDESHYLKGWQSKRSKNVRDMAFHCRPHYLFMLTGTPVTKTAEDWLNPLFIMGRCPWGTNGEILQDTYKSKEHFYNTFCEYENKTIKVWSKKAKRKVGIRNKTYIGLREENLHRLDKLLEGKYIRRLSEDMLDLPPLQRKDIIISESVNDGLMKAFKTYQAGPMEMSMSVSEIKSKASYIKTRYTLPYMKGLYEEVQQPILVYTDHVRTAKFIGAELLKKKYKVNVITGETKDTSRQISVDRFQQGELNFLIATIGSSNTGYNFTNCRNIIFNDLSWRADQNKQVEKRIHRKGQTGSCMIHRMIGDAADEHILKILEQKDSDIEKLVK